MQKLIKLSPFLSKFMFLMFFFIAICSCNYRFSNLYYKAPLGSKTIAVEGIYDTSKVVVPHSYLWKSLQKEFVINGVLKLAPQSRADLYLTTQIVDISINPQNIQGGGRLKEPEHFNIDAATGRNPHPLNAYPSYKQSGAFALENIMRVSILVELWDLRTNEQLFSRSYYGDGAYNVYHPNSAVEYGFLMADESYEGAFRGIADSLARSVVRGVLSG